MTKEIDISYGIYGDAVKSLMELQKLSEEGAIKVLEIAVSHGIQLAALENEAITKLIEQWLSTEPDPEGVTA